jgi:hypothetical protein
VVGIPLGAVKTRSYYALWALKLALQERGLWVNATEITRGSTQFGHESRIAMPARASGTLRIAAKRGDEQDCTAGLQLQLVHRY